MQARQKCETLLDQYKDNVKQLADRPTRLDLFSSFVASKEAIKDQSRVMAKEKDEVDRMYALMADYHVSVPEADVASVRMMETSMGQVAHLVAQCESQQEERTTNFTNDIEKSIETLRSAATELRSDSEDKRLFDLHARPP